MRKIIVWMSVSIDGYLQGPDGDSPASGGTCRSSSSPGLSVVLGRGKPLFPRQQAAAALDLIETRTFGNGVVLLRYLRRAPR